MFARHISLLLAGALLLPAAHADERTARIDASAVAGITLVLTPPMLHTRAPLNQKTLAVAGCTFTTAFQHDKHAAMLDILKRHLVDIPADEAARFLLRNAVYLRMTDGSTVRYLIGRADGPNGIVHGGSETGATASYLPFKSDEALLRALREWAADGTAQKEPSSRCLDKRGFLQQGMPQP